MGNIFDILGPVMVGPSSSHTAGAVRIGMVARQLFGRQPERAEVYLHGSFAATGKGHGTDRALIAGLLGMMPDDMRIPDSYEVAKDMGMDFVMKNKNIKGAHPNTAQIIMEAEGVPQMKIQAHSIGGGRICVCKLDGIDVNFSGESCTLIILKKYFPQSERIDCGNDVCIPTIRLLLFSWSSLLRLLQLPQSQ